jgi:hypothetical protein
MSRSFFVALYVFTFSLAASNTISVTAGEPIVPGTGEFLADCSDDFEAEDWSYTLRLPKSSHEQDDNQRSPGGISNNGLWHEGAKRGTPDVVKRVPTPPGGIEGSTGALLFSTKNSGIPGRASNEQQQDDLLMMFNRRLGGPIPVAWQPSCTVRVYLPSFDQWEQRSGPSFGMRADCVATAKDDNEPYWPGMFLLFQRANGRNITADSAKITVRSNQRGFDVRSHEIAEPGWWTLGMSFSADGQVHYYASPGVDDLTADDYLMSSYPYGYRCQQFNNFFFNVANWDNGRTWSTPWVIDDPKVYVIPPPGKTVANLHRLKPKAQAQNQRQPQQQQRGQATRPQRPQR